MDEMTKLMRGYIPLSTGDWRFQAENPPLHSIINAIPLFFFSGRPDPTQLSEWDDPAWQTRWPSLIYAKVASGFQRTYESLIFPSRLTSIIVAILLILLISGWVYREYGAVAGLVALFWFSFSPNWLAHSYLVSNDIMAAGFFTLATLSFYRTINSTSKLWIIITGIALGLGLASKTSVFLLFPVFVLHGLVYIIGIKDKERFSFPSKSIFINRSKYIISRILLVTGIGFLTLWLSYGFEAGSWWSGGIPLPLSTYITKIIIPTYRHASGGHATYLLGNRSYSGWWYYFPVVFLIKTPIATIIGASWGMLHLGLKRYWNTLLLLTVPPGLWIGAAMLTKINIGYRHILPILPFLIIIIARLARDLVNTRWRKIFFILLSSWLVIVTVSNAPNYLAYFNELIGGPRNGRFWLSDSNIDWGQDLENLRRYIQENNLKEVYLSYFGIPELPDQYGISYKPFPNVFNPNDPSFMPYNPPPGTYVVSITHLTGQTLYPMFDYDPLDWFNHQGPCGLIGYSMLVFCVTPDNNPPQWLVICSPLDDLISVEQAKQRLGRPDIGVSVIDCSTAEVPGEYESSGWVILSDDQLGSSKFVDHFQANGILEYEYKTFEGDVIFNLIRYNP
jgi:4-amino-4-deoxy-L-arabinose transferase-like glycosyltransferase